jgi:hypothetical protein
MVLVLVLVLVLVRLLLLILAKSQELRAKSRSSLSALYPCNPRYGFAFGGFGFTKYQLLSTNYSLRKNAPGSFPGADSLLQLFSS